MSMRARRERLWHIVLPAAVFALVLAIAILLPAAQAAPVQDQPLQADIESDGQTDGAQEVKTSHRLIVQLQAPPLAERVAAAGPERLQPDSPTAQAYIEQLQAEQAAFVSNMNQTLPSAAVATYLNESGQEVEATYQVVFNGVAVDPGDVDPAVAQRQLQQLPNVKAVFRDYAHYPDLYASLPLINAAALWDNAAVGGRADAGSGVKVASVDGGLHHEAPMFDGTGFDYPPGYPKGFTENTNGKIIVSRVYFRTWDPPTPDNAAPWPGDTGTSHGVHTGSTAVGNIVTDAEYAGVELPTLSGVAPGAWAMSYKVFYNSVTGDGSFYTVEGIAALEDAVNDGADVINNSWGGGPGSVGGAADPLDTALINAVEAGVFVSMSAGNAGPGLGTGDHPSENYINAAASTTSGTYVFGQLSVSAPEPVSDTLKEMPFGTALFGPPLTPGEVNTYPYLPTAAVAPGNLTGCAPFDPNTFDGHAALISRGSCSFGTKVFYAQEAGAEFVIIYNNAGDEIINMSFACDPAGCSEDDITISSVFIGQTNGEGMVAWYNDNGAASEVELNTVPFQAGNVPDVIANFSSRGPGVGAVLKPDIVAPGVNIMAQGYDPIASGEAAHLGFGQVSGTSMAAPHVSGAAAVILDAHPTWAPQQIKSAIMSTAKYTDVYNLDGSPAQPLDMGAGRLDLTNVADPGVFLNPPSLGYGYMVSGTTKTMEVVVTSAAAASETYEIETLYTGGGFTMTTSLPGFTVSPTSITLAPGEWATIEVTFDTATSQGIGDNQGYVVLDGPTHDAHFPVWARVMPEPDTTADVLVIDNDGSSDFGFTDYHEYYTSTLDNLGINYDYHDADMYFGNETTIPEASVLASYEAIVYFTGDKYLPDGSASIGGVPISTALTELDTNRLVEYANQGGAIIAMGQDATGVLNESFFQLFVLGAEQLQDSITDEELPDLPVVPFADAPPEFDNIAIDLGTAGDGAENQYYIDELENQDLEPDPVPGKPDVYLELFRYPGPLAMEDGTVGLMHRSQPSLEFGEVEYLGRSIFTSFGLEGVNNGLDTTTREELMQHFLNWAFDEPEVNIAVLDYPEEAVTTVFSATVTSNISGTVGWRFRWDFGDNSGFFGPYESNTASHMYDVCGTHIVRVEAVDSWGNAVIGEMPFEVTENCHYEFYLPLIMRAAMPEE